MEDDVAAKMEILEDDGDIVTFTLNGTSPFMALPKTIENDQASFTINEECSCYYADEDDERFLVVRNDDRVLVVELNWDDDIESIRILEVDPDNHDPMQAH